MPRKLGKRPELLCLLLVAAAITGCSVPRRPVKVDLSKLKSAAWCRKEQLGRFIVTDGQALLPLYRPIARRLGLIEIRSPGDWELLRAAVAELGVCPDLSRGIIIGLVGPTGTILTQSWPFNWIGVRAADGAGLVEARFEGGTYLADDATYVELAQVEGVHFVAAVRIDGISYTGR